MSTPEQQVNYHIRQGQYEEALAIVEEALLHNQNSISALGAKAEILYYLGNYESAINWAEAARSQPQEDPKSLIAKSKALIVKAKALANTQRAETAILELRAGLEVNLPTIAALAICKSQILWDLGNRKEAMANVMAAKGKLVEKGDKEGTVFTLNYLTICACRIYLDDPVKYSNYLDMALSSATAATAVFPSDNLSKINRARILSKLGRVNEAIEYLQRIEKPTQGILRLLSGLGPDKDVGLPDIIPVIGELEYLRKKAEKKEQKSAVTEISDSIPAIQTRLWETLRKSPATLNTLRADIALYLLNWRLIPANQQITPPNPPEVFIATSIAELGAWMERTAAEQHAASEDLLDTPATPDVIDDINNMIDAALIKVAVGLSKHKKTDIKDVKLLAEATLQAAVPANMRAEGSKIDK